MEWRLDEANKAVQKALVNRILGRRAAVVEDTPGVTRDRVSYDAEWSGTEFKLVDTGGWEADVEGIESAIASQAQIAVQLSDAVILVVDGHVGTRVGRLWCFGRFTAAIF